MTVRPFRMAALAIIMETLVIISGAVQTMRVATFFNPCKGEGFEDSSIIGDLPVFEGAT